MELLYTFWELYILENDKYFIFYFALAILKFKKREIKELEDLSFLPITMSNLTITTKEQFQ